MIGLSPAPVSSVNEYNDMALARLLLAIVPISVIMVGINSEMAATKKSKEWLFQRCPG
jgi:hypothetical protein